MSQGKHTYQEIMSQGSSWKQTLDAADELPKDLVDWLRNPGKLTVFIGCGSTYYLSLTAASIWQKVTGVLAKAVPSSELWLFPDLVLDRRPASLVAISRSGETSETLKAVDVFREQGREDFLSIVCYADSRLAQRSPFLLLTQDAAEESVAQTRSFSSMLILFQYAAGLAAENINYLNEVKAIPGAFDGLVNNYESLAKKLGEDHQLEHFVFLGSGPNYGLACEAMLKMKEMSLSTSEAFHCLEFRHGPKSMVTPKTLVIGLLSDSAREEEVKVLAEMKELGATTVAISEKGDGLDADHTVELGSEVSELARGVLMLPVLQLMAYYRSMSKGLDPDRPKNLDAVVKF